MKNLKKHTKVTRVFFAAIVVTVMCVMRFAYIAPAAEAIGYYDENGNQITVNGLYYNSHGYPMYNASCYYLDGSGNPVYVGGCRVYYSDESGNLAAGNYYYDVSGKAVRRPASYPGGLGCGMWYYDDDGNAVNGPTYYDDFGNAVQNPEAAYYPGGCCGQSR